MNRFRWIAAIALLIGSAGLAQGLPAKDPEAEVLDRLTQVFETGDPVRIASAWRAMGDYGLPAANTVETRIARIGEKHLENGDIDTAIAVFRLNADTFPTSANSWNALAEAMFAKGEQRAALRYFRRSLLIDPHNSKATQMVEVLSPAIG